MKTLHVAAVAAVALGLAACGGGESEAEPAPATVTVTETAAGEPSTATPSTSTEPAPEPAASPSLAEPNVGDLALQLGEWREGTLIRTKVLKVEQPERATRPDFLSDNPEAEGAVALVRQCVRETSTEPLLVGIGSWAASDARSSAYDYSGTSWDTWPPLPQYPYEKSLRPGDCTEGWVLISAPDGTKITTVQLVAEGITTAEWLVR